MIDSNDKPLPDESYLQFLRRKRAFYQLLIESWSLVEVNIDHLLTRQYGLYCEYSNPKVQTLTKSSFQSKLESLKGMGVISPEEYRIIHAFKVNRNTYFHKLGADVLFIMPDDEKDRTMDEAVKVAQLHGGLLFPLASLWVGLLLTWFCQLSGWRLGLN